MTAFFDQFTGLSALVGGQSSPTPSAAPAPQPPMPNGVDAKGRTALHRLLKDPNAPLAEVQRLLRDGPAMLLDAVTTSGKTAAYYALQRSNRPVLRWLLMHAGARIDGRYCNGPLHLTMAHVAAYGDDHLAIADLVACVRRRGGDVAEYLDRADEQVGPRGGVILHVLPRGAQSNMTPMHYAAYADSCASLIMLHRHGADADAMGCSGWRPLHVAAKRGCVGAIAVLLAADVDVNAAKIDGVTALHLAAMNGHEHCVRMLLLAGASTDLAADDGRTVEQMATDDLKPIFRHLDVDAGEEESSMEQEEEEEESSMEEDEDEEVPELVSGHGAPSKEHDRERTPPLCDPRFDDGT